MKTKGKMMKTKVGLNLLSDARLGLKAADILAPFGLSSTSHCT